jgi:hypothetical protein
MTYRRQDEIRAFHGDCILVAAYVGRWLLVLPHSKRADSPFVAVRLDFFCGAFVHRAENGVVFSARLRTTLIGERPRAKNCNSDPPWANWGCLTIQGTNHFHESCGSPGSIAGAVKTKSLANSMPTRFVAVLRRKPLPVTDVTIDCDSIRFPFPPVPANYNHPDGVGS